MRGRGGRERAGAREGVKGGREGEYEGREREREGERI